MPICFPHIRDSQRETPLSIIVAVVLRVAARSGGVDGYTATNLL
jgi:hypothetical protein